MTNVLSFSLALLGDFASYLSENWVYVEIFRRILVKRLFLFLVNKVLRFKVDMINTWEN